jgi:hypothetical protein
MEEKTNKGQFRDIGNIGHTRQRTKMKKKQKQKKPFPPKPPTQLRNQNDEQSGPTQHKSGGTMVLAMGKQFPFLIRHPHVTHCQIL